MNKAYSLWISFLYVCGTITVTAQDHSLPVKIGKVDTLDSSVKQNISDGVRIKGKYNSSGIQVVYSNSPGLSASLNVSLTRGNYYISIDGTGAGDPASNGYSD